MARLEAMVESAQAALALLDAHFSILLANPVWDQIGVCPRGRMIGRGFFELFPNPEQEEVFSRARDTGQPVAGTRSHSRADRQNGNALSYWDWTLSPVLGRDGRVEYLALSMVEVTQRVLLQQKLEDFVRAVSHDLRSPLTAVLGHAQIIQRMPARLDVVQRGSGAIVLAARRMNAMIQELVDLVRAETSGLKLNRTAVDLPQYAAEMKEQSPDVRESGRIRVKSPKRLPPVSADPLRIERVLANLLSDALRHADPGTEVTVAFAARDGDIVTSILYRGPGIPLQDLRFLFERARPGMAGSKMTDVRHGLYVARVLVEAHGGRIWAESKPSGTTTISFSLPTTAGKD